MWPITQAPGNLDKQFRSVAEDFSVLRNEYTAKYGPFRGRGRFVRKTYLQEPSPNAEPFETATFSLDVQGVASCYDTAKGIGVHGSMADIGRRAKGIPIWVVMPTAAVLGLACIGVPWLLGKGASKFATGKTAKAAGQMPIAAGRGSASQAQSQEKAWPVVSGVMVRSNGLYVAVLDRGWIRVVANTPAGDVQLEDGTIVRRADVVRGGGVSAALESKKPQTVAVQR